MSWQLVAIVAGAAALLLLSVAASAGVRSARDARLARRRADWDRLDRWRERIERQFVDSPSLIALYDEKEDLRTSDPHTRARLHVLALMHLDLFQAANDLIAGLGRREARRAAAHRERWERYMRAVYGGSSLVRRALADGDGRYAPELAARLRATDEADAPPDAAEPPRATP